jgi:hypothetical protein
MTTSAPHWQLGADGPGHNAPHLNHYLDLGFWDVDGIYDILAMLIGMLTMGFVCDRLHVRTTFASHGHSGANWTGSFCTLALRHLFYA